MAEPGDLVVMYWLDAVCDVQELSAKDASEPVPVATYGMLLEANRKWVRVAGEVVGGGRYRSVTTIPKALVDEIKALTIPDGEEGDE